MKKKVLTILIIIASIILCLSTISAKDSTTKIYNFNHLTMENKSDMVGCCSVIMQLDGNDSVVSFRRDADNNADLTIEEQNWHGQKVLKQYKESNGYFVQVIITSDGWVVTYGGKDDGKDNQLIENITGEMVKNKKISDKGLQQVQDIKNRHHLGHMVIKAPNGDYGLAMSDRHYQGHLNPHDYLSVPNKYTYFRNGTSDSSNPMNSTIKLAMNDAFGLTRKNIMSYQYSQICNDTFNGSTIDIYASNDDGSTWGLKDASGADNFRYNNTFYDKKDIPIAPNKEYVGTHKFNYGLNNKDIDFVTPLLAAICIGIGGHILYQYYLLEQKKKQKLKKPNNILRRRK